MALSYRVIERKVNKKDKESGQVTLKPVRIAVQVSKGRIPVEDVARRIEKETALGFGDVLSVLASLGPVVAEYASLGYSVDLDRFGIFTPRISAAALSDEKKPYTADLIRGAKIRFTPAVALRERAKRFSYEVVNAVDGSESGTVTPKPEDEGGTAPGGTSEAGGI